MSSHYSAPLALAFVTLTSLATAQIPTAWTVTSADTSADGLRVTYRFKNGEAYRPRIVRPTLVGAGESASETPFLLFRGADCDDCDAGLSLYIAVRRDSASWSLHRFPYPGEGDGWVYFKARAFYGACTTEPFDVVWLVAATGTGSWHDEETIQPIDASPRLYVARVRPSGVGAALLPATARVTTDLEQRLRAGACWEIPPVQHLAEVGFEPRR